MLILGKVKEILTLPASTGSVRRLAEAAVRRKITLPLAEAASPSLARRRAREGDTPAAPAALGESSPLQSDTIPIFPGF
jgi:hypothetical protein